MNIAKTTIIAAMALTIAAPIGANAGEGPYERGGKNVFEINRENRTAAKPTLDLRSGIGYGTDSSGYSGNYISDQPYEINGKSVFDHNRDLRAKRIASEKQQDGKAITSTTKKSGWFQRHFRSVRGDES